SLHRTDDRGAFRFSGLMKADHQFEPPTGYSLIVKKQGLAGTRTGHFFVPGANGLQQLDTLLVLRPGYSVPVRILDEQGQGVEGAWVQALEGMAKLAKSDREGHCVLRDVPEGTHSVYASYGDQTANAKVTVTPASASEPAVMIRLAKTERG